MNQNADLYTLMENLPPESPAWSLVDAFDAVTNGLENPECFALMEGLEDVQLRPWQHLVRAIRALYAGDTVQCREAAGAIEDDSAPAILKPFFRAWFIRQGTSNRDRILRELSDSPEAVIRLYHRIIIEPHPLSLLAEQAEEALRHDMEEQFELLAGRVLKGLRALPRCDGPLLALRYGMYCLKLLDDTGYGDANFFSALRKILGEADSLCALGFTLLDRDHQAASSALRGALKAGDGLFLDTAMAKLIAETIALLEGGEYRDEDPAFRSAAAENSRPGLEKEPYRQLDLFGSSHG